MNPTLLEAKDVMLDADCLYSESELNVAIQAVALQMNDDLKDLNPLLVCLLTGGMVFLGQLLPKLNFPLEISYVHATRYHNNTQGSSEVTWLAHAPQSFKDRHLVLIDDIYDEGGTLMACLKTLASEAASIRTAVLVNKRHNRKQDPNFMPDYIGVDVEDAYVFGYGMDYKGYWRNAPGIFAVASA
jgi:hypoxanthine phosphoribosyltransferase